MHIKKIFSSQRFYVTALSVALGVTICTFGYYIIFQSKSSLSINSLAPVDVRENSSDYKFINPLLFSKTSKSLYASEYQSFVDTIDTYIQKVKTAGQADSISVYFRDLDTGHWTGINEDEKYNPASMLKVAVLVTYLKDADKDPTILSDRLYYPGSDYTGQYYIPSGATKSSGNLTVSQLLKLMIEDSDNVALDTLEKYRFDDFSGVYKDFRLPLPATSTNDYMSARSYSVIFRSLYNSTYLPWDMSEKALEMLTTTDFKDGLVAGLSSSTIVAHKFGETTIKTEEGSIVNRELHDCGIVYYPDHPYLLCVMTRGQDFPTLAGIIADISKLTYTYVDATINK